MPIVGASLHIIIALFFAAHAVRSGQNTYWLFILLAIPFLGSAVYFFSIYLPNSRLPRHARQLTSSAVNVLDPSREVREAQMAYDYAPTAQNEVRLAQALLGAGQAQASLQHFEACLRGPFANDMDIRWGAAQAAYAAGQPQQALTHLRQIAETDARFRAEAAGLLAAKSYAALGDQAMARKSFDSARERFGGFDVTAEYAIWSAGQGDWSNANSLQAELEKSMAYWNSQQRSLNKEMLQRLKAAFARQPK